MRIILRSPFLRRDLPNWSRRIQLAQHRPLQHRFAIHISRDARDGVLSVVRKYRKVTPQRTAPCACCVAPVPERYPNILQTSPSLAKIETKFTKENPTTTTTTSTRTTSTMTNAAKLNGVVVGCEVELHLVHVFVSPHRHCGELCADKSSGVIFIAVGAASHDARIRNG